MFDRPVRLACLALPAGLAILAAGCDEASSGYRPFSSSNYADRRAVTVRLHEMGELSDDVAPADAASRYGQILTDYTTPLTEAGLTESVADRFLALTDAHSYGDPAVGTYLDGQMRAAITLGSLADTSNADAARDAVWAHEAVEYFGLVYTYLTVYGDLAERTRMGLDQAYGAYSFVPLSDGTSLGLYANAEEREPIFSVELNAPIEAAFIEARALVVSGTTGNTDPVGPDAALDAAIDSIDRKMLRIFAYGARRYLLKLRDQPSVEADGNLIEARVLWSALRPWAEANAASSAATVTSALYPTGEAASSDTGLHVAYGLAAYHTAPYDGDAPGALTALATILAALEAP